MKLSARQIEQVQEQIGVEPIPEDSPAQQQLKDHFGDHTFYVDARGLHIWEDLEPSGAPTQAVTAVQVARWTDEEKTALAPHAPQPGNAMVEVDRDTAPEE